MLASEILDEVEVELGDTANARWTTSKLIGHLNAALDALLLLRPDAFAGLSSVLLAAGAVQSVPASAPRFLGAIRNMGADGATEGRVIRNSDIGAMDAFDPDWMSATQAAAITDVFFNAQTPDSYYCYPPASSSPAVYIQIRTADYHTRISASTDSVALSRRFRVVLIYFVLSFAYEENTDVGSKQLAERYAERATALATGAREIEAAAQPAAKGDPA